MPRFVCLPFSAAFSAGFCAIFLAACTGADAPKDTGEDGLDADHDGYTAGADCDDHDPDRHPGVPELCDGIDQDCDGEVDEDPVDGVDAWPDADGDTYGDEDGAFTACSVPAGAVTVGGDCDDGDGAIHPGADEHCDGVDEDCDGTPDDDPVDPTTWYTDADHDGYGDPDGSVVSCAQPPDTATTPGDCDDADAAVNPGATELCNGVDDDCDGAEGVGWTVPDDYPTLTDAVAAASDGATICLQAGTYAERVDFGGTSLTVEGVGRDAVTIDGGGGGSVLSLLGGESVTLRELTVSGGVAEWGGGIRVDFPAALTLETVRVSGNRAVGCDEVAGGGIYVEGTLVATDLELLDNEAGVDGDGYCVVYGGGIGGYTGDVTLTGLVARGNRATGRMARGGAVAVVDGSLAVDGSTFEDNAVEGEGESSLTLNGGAVYVGASPLVVADTTFAGNAVRAVDGGVCYLGGGALQSEGGNVTLTDVVSDGDASEASCSSFAYVDGGAVGLNLSDVDLARLTRVELRDSVAAVSSGESYSYVNGGALVIYGDSDVELTDVRVTGTDATSDGGWFGAIYGAGVCAFAPVVGERLWVSDVTGTATTFAFGGGAYFADTLALTNGVFANNALTAGEDAYGAGLSLEPYRAEARVENADVVGNTLTAPRVIGAGAQVQFATAVDLVNVNLVGNVLAGVDTAEGAAAGLLDASPVSVTWSNAYGNGGGGDWYGIAATDPYGVDPLYTDVSAGDAASWELTLGAGSPLIDAGDPSLLDADGSVSDVGAYGGPAGAWP